MSYLKENNGHKSSQRVNLIGALAGTLYLISTVGFYIISRSFTEEGIGESEWFGMGAFVLGLLGGLGINAGVKAYQKKFEERGSNENS